MHLAEIPYPRINPDLLHLGPITVRWYGVSYVVAFALAWWVLTGLAKRKRWPVEPDRVADVLFWGILGVFIGARVGWILFYGIHMPHFTWSDAYKVWEGGMSFHGGLLGVIIAYSLFVWRTKKPVGAFFDGLALATPLGIFCVRMGNFINAELFGRPWDGPWSMRFPLYESRHWDGPVGWAAAKAEGTPYPLYTEPRHPSQLYEAFGEGLLLFFFLRWLMLRKGVGGGRIAGVFLMGYGTVRFFIEYAREPDAPLKGLTGIFTRGQQLCLGMILAGLVILVICAVKKARASRPADS